MKKKYACEIDCAVCAAKVEDAIKKLEGVKDATVNFMTQKLTIEAEDGYDMEDVLDRAVKAGKKIEPDFEVEIK